jgi:hypothetical protein
VFLEIIVNEWIKYVCLFVCLFIATRAIFQLSGGCHHCRWQGCKFRPMLRTQGLWAGRDLYRATATATRDLGLYSLIRKTGVTKYFEPGWKLTRGVIFQRWILRPEVLNLDPTPLRIEPDRGILIRNPVQNSTALKHVISTPMVYSIKNLNFIPGFTFFWFIMEKILFCRSPERYVM